MWPTARPGSYAEFSAQFGAPDLADWSGFLAPYAGSDRRLFYVGCGGGRRAVPLAQDGWTLHCVDRDAACVAAFRERLAQDERVVDFADRIVVEHADAAQTACTDDFDLVVLPDFVLNTSPPDQQPGLLAAAAKRCREGGAVVIDALNPFPFVAHGLAHRAGPADGGGLFPAEVGREPAWVSSELYASGADAARACFHLVAAYRVRYADGDVREFTAAEVVHWLLPRDLLRLAADAGLRPWHLSCDIAEVRWRIVLRG